MPLTIDSSRPVDPTSGPDQQISVPTDVVDAVAQLIDHARLGRKGVFWALGDAYKNLDSSLFQPSLAYGSAGILLALLAYYRATGDSAVLDVLEKGADWLGHSIRENPFAHGYYGGTSGSMVVLKRLSGVLGIDAGFIRRSLLDTLQNLPDGDVPSNLVSGLAGTIVGASMLFEEEITENPSILHSCIERLTRNAMPHPDGVFWDFQPTSLQPPVGFLFGNAGVEYALAVAARATGVHYPALLRGSLDYDRSVFDFSCGNWVDFDCPQRMAALQPTEVERALASGKIEALISSFHPEDSLSWGGGTLGILLSRMAVKNAFAEVPGVTDAVKRDLVDAIARIERAGKNETTTLPDSFSHGFPGIVSVLRLVEGVISPAAVSSLIHDLEAEEDSRPILLRNGDLSLFTGVAGRVYLKLKLLMQDPDCLCVDPAGMAKPSNGLQIPLVSGDLESWANRRIPHISGIEGAKSAITQAQSISLRVLREVVESGVSSTPDNATARSARHELDLLGSVVGVSFLAAFWREIAKQRDATLCFGEGMDDAILFGTFRLDESALPVEFDWDPYNVEAQDGPVAPTYLIRRVSSRGVWEGKLSPLQYALIKGFEKPAVGLDVIHDVIRRVDTPGVTRQQLAELALRMVRGFIHEGCLVRSPSGWLASRLTAARLRKVRTLLLPPKP